MPLSDWQGSYNGLTFGPGTAYSWIAAENLYDKSAATNDIDKVGGGTYAGRDEESGKLIVLTLELLDTSTFATTLPALLAAFPCPSNTDHDLLWKVPGITNNRKVTGRCRRRSFPVGFQFARGYCLATIGLFLPDPTIYDATTSAVVDY